MSTDTLRGESDSTPDVPARAPTTARDVLREVRDRVRRQPVLWTAAAMIVVQLGYRAWAVAGGWFLIDDYVFLSDAADQPLSLDYLFRPHNDHLQPFGLFWAWVADQTGPFNWTFVVVVVIVLQALANVAALVFLVRLLGRRWAVLVPLGFYLFSVVTLPAYLWWAASMLQVPLQIAAFTALAAHVEYVRTRRLRHVVVTALALVLGMACDVKIVFVAIGLVFLSLYLNDGSGRRRWVDALWGQRLAWVVHGSLFVGYLVLYLVINPLGGREAPDRLGVFETMFRYTLGPVLVGGPWEWGPMGDIPLVPVQPPEWGVTLAWVALTVVLLEAVRRQRSTAWALVPLVVAVVVNAWMVAAARGGIFGSALGLEVRYLGDLAPLLTMIVAIIAGGLLPRGGRPQVAPVPAAWRTRSARIVGAVCVVAALVGSAVSSHHYVANWHSDFPARAYTENVITQSEIAPIRVLDQGVPDAVLPAGEETQSTTAPSRLFAPLGDRFEGLQEGNDAAMLDDSGTVRQASVVAQALSPAGTDPSCGYPVGSESGETLVELEPFPGQPPLSDYWWGSIGYLASGAGVVELKVGVNEVRMEVSRGIHTFFFRGVGSADLASLTAVTDTVVCVDRIAAGTLLPLGGVTP